MRYARGVGGRLRGVRGEASPPSRRARGGAATDNASLLVGSGWLTSERVSCTLGVTTLVVAVGTSAAALRGASSLAAQLVPATQLVQLGAAAPVPVLHWRSTWPVPRTWHQGAAVAAQSALPPALRVGGVGGGNATYDAFMAGAADTATPFDPSSTATTLPATRR